jgi:rhamnosyltransferase
MAMSENILISIVIPVKNGDAWLHQCIRGIMKQTLFDRTEIIAVDSGSTDKSLEILEQYPVKVIRIPAGDFNHGLTRNFALDYCRGEYVVMTVQDARPVDEYWLQKLLDGFAMAEKVGGVCGQQVVPHEPEANPAGWFRPFSEPSCTIYQFSSPLEFDQLTPLQKKNCCGWDNVTAMYRKEALMRIPFQKTVYGEDAVWARDALRAGYAIVYNPAARVYHYHIENADYAFRRTLTTLYFRKKIFGFVHDMPRLSFRNFLSLGKSIWIAKGIGPVRKLNWLIESLKQHQASKRAHALFYEAMEQGDGALDALHEKYCGQPPVPLKLKQYDQACS